jgi:hypothetical protein
MKFLPSQLAYLTTDREARTNLRARAKYPIFLAALATLYALLFHVIKLNVEHEEHSWVTRFYWTLVVMTTLGFGDITFTSDIGRIVSIVELLSGVVFLLVMLSFLFIRLGLGRARRDVGPVSGAVTPRVDPPRAGDGGPVRRTDGGAGRRRPGDDDGSHLSAAASWRFGRVFLPELRGLLAEGTRRNGTAAAPGF